MIFPLEFLFEWFQSIFHKVEEEWPGTCRWRRQVPSRGESRRWSSRKEMSLPEKSKCFASFWREEKTQDMKMAWRQPSAQTGVAPIGRAKSWHKAANPIDDIKLCYYQIRFLKHSTDDGESTRISLSPANDINLVDAPPNGKSQNNQPRLQMIGWKYPNISCSYQYHLCVYCVHMCECSEIGLQSIDLAFNVLFLAFFGFV